MTGYVNDVSQGTISGSGNGSGANNTNFVIGKYGQTNTNIEYLNGKVDEVVVLNRVLTSSEISNLYNNGAGVEVCSVRCGAWLSSLQQYKSNATTTIAEGAKTDETTVVFGANINAATSTANAQLQIEVQPAGVSFTNTSTTTSGQYSSGSFATTSITFTNPGHYHWQARVLDSTGATSTWSMFGPSSTSTDFIVDPEESVLFNGSSAWKWPATNLGFNSTDPFTIEMWYNTDSTSTPMQLFDTRNTTSSDGFAIWKDLSGINFSVNCDGASSTIHLAGAAATTKNDNDGLGGHWHHIAISKAATISSTDAYKLYFDTMQQESTKCYNSTSTDSIWIGGNPSSTYPGNPSISSSSMNIFNGNIDEVRVWKTERSSSSISTYYNQEVTSTDSNLLGLWRFNATSTDLVTGNSPTGQYGNPTYSTSTPFGHFVLGFSSVSSSAIYYNASTTYSTAWSAAVSIWNGSPQRPVGISSTSSVNTANLLVADVYNSSTYADVVGNYCNVTYTACVLGSPTKDTIYFNTFALASSTASSTQNVAEHELGHALGLAHSFYGNVMNYYQTTLTSLGTQDIKDYDFCWVNNNCR